jgi:hypothetical protein
MFLIVVLDNHTFDGQKLLAESFDFWPVLAEISGKLVHLPQERRHAFILKLSAHQV